MTLGARIRHDWKNDISWKTTVVWTCCDLYIAAGSKIWYAYKSGKAPMNVLVQSKVECFKSEALELGLQPESPGWNYTPSNAHCKGARTQSSGAT